MVYLYNTLGRKKEAFKPIKGKEVGMYTCGPTVYWHQHVGNMRTYVFSDLLRRMLVYSGYRVKQVMNYTDVGHLTSDADEGEDKIEKAAKKEGKKAKEIANFYIREFEEDSKKLNILKPWKVTRATEHIKEQMELIKKLEKKGYAYRTKDGIYFDSSKFKKYGDLALLNISGLESGKRVAVGDKKRGTDFALWKFSREGEKRQQEWEFEGRKGFPGWHIECSAMSMKYLGEHFDIHTGGEDHIPVHHTNEIAQSEAATGKKFVNYWLHGAFLIVNGEKVSKSKGGLYTISELEKEGYSPLVFRYLCLLTHYRKPLNFSLEQLDAAKSALGRIKRKIIEVRETEKKAEDKSEEYRMEFSEAVSDDLNVPLAVQVFLRALDDLAFDGKKKLKLLEEFDEVLGIDVKAMKDEKIKVPAEVKKLVDAREDARREKRWAEADILRQRILERGFRIEDKEDWAKLSKV